MIALKIEYNLNYDAVLIWQYSNHYLLLFFRWNVFICLITQLIIKTKYQYSLILIIMCPRWIMLAPTVHTYTKPFLPKPNHVISLFCYLTYPFCVNCGIMKVKWPKQLAISLQLTHAIFYTESCCSQCWEWVFGPLHSLATDSSHSVLRWLFNTSWAVKIPCGQREKLSEAQ